MTTTLGPSRNRSFLSLFTASLFGVALLVAAASPVLAKEHGHQGKNGNGHAYGNQGRQVRSENYRVPQVIAVEHRGDYRPYFTGRTYYAPHNHYHAAYRFPVWVNGAVVYRPYVYCDDHLFVSGAVNLPRLAIAFNFGQPGVAVGGYYGSGGYYGGGYYAVPAPPPPSYYVYEEPRRHHCEHDRDWDDD